MSSSISIRMIQAEDRAAWAPLWRDYLAFYKTELPDSTYDATFARYADPAVSDMRGWIAWDGDTPVGLVHSIAYPHGGRPEPVTYLQDLFTTPAARGKGIARALIETVYSDADTAGRPAVYWLTQTGNATARGLYDTLTAATDFMVYRRVAG